MEEKKRRALEEASFRIGDAADFLELTREERLFVELRVALTRALRRRREEQHLTQKELAARLKSSQSRVAKMEAGAPDVSLDMLFRGLFAVGGQVEDLVATARSATAKKRTKKAGA